MTKVSVQTAEVILWSYLMSDIDSDKRRNIEVWGYSLLVVINLPLDLPVSSLLQSTSTSVFNNGGYVGIDNVTVA